MKIKSTLAACLLLVPIVSQAGFAGLTWHSRANCMRYNESITWHYGHENDLRTVSDHRFYANPKYSHVIADPTLDYPTPENNYGYRITVRSAAYHNPEGSWRDPAWGVYGYHWIRFNKRDHFQLGTTNVNDCSIYNGWWDF